ncbi:MAG: hypothetical protein ACI8QS_000255 [Planctomycetota bacterium]|jgi:hypothetical protein
MKKTTKCTAADSPSATQKISTPSESSQILEATQATVLSGRLLGKGVVVNCEAERADAHITIAFDSSLAPELPVGQDADVAFARGAAGAGFEVSGLVVGRSEDYRGVLYRLVFQGGATRALSPLVNRRGTLRVYVDSETAVKVQLETLDESLKLALKATDVSATGISVKVSADDELMLTGTRQVKLLLLLPGDPIPKAIQGEILRRRFIDSEVRYGIRFESRGNLAEREAILQWVKARHREELMQARAAHRKSPSL